MRAARFALNTEETYKPISDEKEDDKRRERAARFGTEFHAVDHSGLQEQGNCFDLDCLPLLHFPFLNIEEFWHYSLLTISYKERALFFSYLPLLLKALLPP